MAAVAIPIFAVDDFHAVGIQDAIGIGRQAIFLIEIHETACLAGHAFQGHVSFLGIVLIDQLDNGTGHIALGRRLHERLESGMAVVLTLLVGFTGHGRGVLIGKSLGQFGIGQIIGHVGGQVSGGLGRCLSARCGSRLALRSAGEPGRPASRATDATVAQPAIILRLFFIFLSSSI